MSAIAGLLREALSAEKILHKSLFPHSIRLPFVRAMVC
jgi:hypothetical protein